MPCCAHAIGALDANHSGLVSAQPQLGGTEQPIHHVVRRAEAVVHELAVALRPDHEQRRQLALRDASGELDVDPLAVVEGTQRFPRRAVASDGVAELDLLQRQAGVHRRCRLGLLRLLVDFHLELGHL